MKRLISSLCLTALAAVVLTLAGHGGGARRHQVRTHRKKSTRPLKKALPI